MPWSVWLTFFAHNARRERPPLPTEVVLDPALRGPLTRTLAVFQAGETGEGRIGAEVRRARPRGTDEVYADALQLFIGEEGTHAARLGHLLRAAGAAPLQRPPAEKVFRAARRAVGVEHELMVLLAAEIVAVVFYGALARGLGDGKLTPVLLDLVADEREHLRFHADFFQANLRGKTRTFKVAFRAIAWAACLTVIADHRATFAALGLRRRELLARVADEIAGVEARVDGRLGFGPATPAHDPHQKELGRKDSNLQHPESKSGALPVELLPSAAAGLTGAAA